MDAYKNRREDYSSCWNRRMKAAEVFRRLRRGELNGAMESTKNKGMSGK